MNPSSGVAGVSWCKRTKRWQVHATIAGKFTSLGRFTNLTDAADARRAAERFGATCRPTGRGNGISGIHGVVATSGGNYRAQFNYGGRTHRGQHRQGINEAVLDLIGMAVKLELNGPF